MARPAFIAPQTDSASLANIDVDGVMRDWQSDYSEDGEPIWDPVLPTLTVAVVLARAEDLIDDRDDAKALRADPSQGLDEDLRDAFQQSDGYDEWRDSFAPMMDAAWPVELAYGVDAQTAADLIDLHAGSVALIARGSAEEPDYEIAMTGGGQDMSADLAIAYMCCGSVPPLKLLARLGEIGENERLARFPVADVYERALDWIDARRLELLRQLELLKRLKG